MPELYPEDQERVNKVLNEGIYKQHRKPFRVWLLLLVILIVLGLITLASYIIAAYHGFV